ncbi:MAG: transglutaminase-like domain-containing protein [Mariniphaga sp.]
MKINLNCFLLTVFIAISACSQQRKDRAIDDIEHAFQQGRLTLATHWADSLLKSRNPDSLTVIRLNSIIDHAHRIKVDFSLLEKDINHSLKKESLANTKDERIRWEQQNWLEYRMIDGEKRYFKRAVPNLKLILRNEETKHNRKGKGVTNHLDLFCLNHSREAIKSVVSGGRPVDPVKMKVTYRLSVNADVVPDGEIVRCWLPWPRELHARQREILLQKTIPGHYFIAPDTVEQRSVYLEKQAIKGKPVVFEIQFNYSSAARYVDIRNEKISPYDTASAVYKRYTSEQYPQIVFSDKIRQLSDSIVRGSSDPVEKVRKLYYWINDHIIWTGALEYSILPDIPGYVLTNRRGDCGMQTLLFMTMARVQHLPVKWQSGWMMHPGDVNLHDWCEVYYEGLGWVPLDMSFNLQKTSDLREEEFYISGIDAYRLIVNDDIGSELVPAKKYARSEPYDFQRGEVEWRGGNLYFDQWDYKMNVEY